MESRALPVSGVIQPGVTRLYHSINIVGITGTGYYYQAFNTVVSDDLGIWDAVNNRIVINRAGVYSCAYAYNPNNNVAVATTPGIEVNAIPYLGADSTTGIHNHINRMFKLAVGDIVKALFYKGTAGTWTVVGGSSGIYDFVVVGPLAGM